MPRGARSISKSGYYHVMVRGVGKQLLFLDDSDHLKYLKTLAAKTRDNNVTLIAWCLMDNHVHLLPQGKLPDIANTMKALGISYTAYFNKKTDQVGPLFQGRYKSFPIESDAYLLDAVRYIHDNPVKSGVGPRETYEWSSYREYLGEAFLINPTVILSMLGGTEGILDFSNSKKPIEYHVPPEKNMTTEELAEIAASTPSGMDAMKIAALPIVQRRNAIQGLITEGFSTSQIQRLTGIGRTAIESCREQFGVRPQIAG